MKNQSRIHKPRKIFNWLQALALLAACLNLVTGPTQAATIVKTATGTDLTAGANWIGGVAPGSGDTATWASTNSLGAGLTLGISQSWSSISVVNALTDIGITGAGTLTLSGGTGIDMSSALVNLSIGSPVALGANSTWNVGLAKTLTVSGVVSESGAGRTLTKSGISTLKLTNANSFSGVTTISAGALNMQNAAALGTTANATTVSSGGTLELQGGITVTAKTLSLNGPGAVSGYAVATESATDAIRNARAYGGALRNVSGENTFSGAITLAGDSRINSLSGTLTLNSGSAIGGAFNLSVGGPGNTTISSAIGSGAGKTLTKDGAGTLTLNSSAVNTFTGGVILNNGALLADFTGVGSTANLINSGNALTMGGGTLIIKAKDSSTAASQTLGNVTTTPLMGSTGGGGQILLNPNGGTATLTLGTLTATAAGSALLMGQTAGSGTATITTTSAKDGNGIYGGRVVYTTDGGTTVDWATTVTSGAPYTLSGLAGGSYTALPTSGGSSSVNYKMTTGTSLGGSFSVNTLKLENPSGDLALGGNTLTFSGSGLLCSGSTATTITGTAGGTRLAGTDLVVHQYNTGGLTIGAVIGGSTILTKAGSQKLTLSGANTHTGVTYLNAGTLNLANQNALAASTVNMNGGTLTFDSSVSGNAFTLGGLYSANTGPGYDVALTNTAGDAITLTHKGGTCYGKFSGSGSLVIAGGVNLYGVHTYAGSTTINSGATLNFGGARCNAAIPNSSSIVNNGTLRLQHGYTPLVQGTDFPSNISGSGNLSIAGSVVILRGANTFSGGVLFDQNNDGCLFLNHDNALGSGTITIANNDYFGSVDATPHTLANNISFTGSSFNFGKGGKTFGGTGDLTFAGTVGLGTSVRSLTVWDTTTVTFSGIVSGAGGGITKAGSGVLALSGGITGNTYTGGATVSAGTMTFLKKIAQPASGTTTVASGAALGLGVGGTADYFSTADVDALWANPCTLALITMNSASLVGIDTSAGDVTYGTSQSTRGLIKLGTNTLTITGTHTYTGATSVNGGTLLVNGSTASGSAVAVRYGGALGGTGTINGTVTVDAGGALRVGSGGNTLTLASSTAPAFAAYSKLNVYATGGTLDKIALSHATPVFACGNIDLVIDTTGLSGDITGATIVQTAKGNGGISGTFRSITVNNGATVTPHYNTASGTITLDLVMPVPVYTVSFNSNGGSAVDSQSVNENTTATQPADPIRTGYAFAGWYSDAGLSSPFNFSTPITGDTTVYAKWTINSYTITASAGAHGSISPSGGTSVNYGGSQSFTISPDSGYLVEDVLVDGGSVGRVTSYNFTSVSANHTISATFIGSLATKLVITSAPVSTIAGVASGTITVQRQQSDNTTVTSDAAITVTLSSDSTGTKTFTPASLTIASGSSEATFTYTDTKAGTPTITAHSGSLAEGTQQETITAAAASQILFATQPAVSTVAGAAFATQPMVKIEDQYGNLVTSGDDATVNVALTLTAGTGVLGGTTSMNAVGGEADFTGKGLNIDLVGSDKVLTATATVVAGTRTATTSPVFSITPATVSKLAFTTQPAGAKPGNAFTTQPVVKTQDTYGNNSTVGLDANKTVTIAIKTGIGTLQGTTTYYIGTSENNGTITGTGLRIDQAGSFTLSATVASGLMEGDSSSFTVAHGTQYATGSPVFIWGTDSKWSSVSGSGYFEAWTTWNDAVFQGTAGTITLNNPIAHNVTFATTGYTLSSGSTLTLNGATPTLTAGSGISATIASAISSSGGVIKAGDGTLTLSGANTFTGGVTLNAGTLKLGSTTALGATAGTLTIAAGTTLDSDNRTISNVNPQTWNGDFTFSGASGTLNLGAGAVTMSGSRQVTVSANTLTVGGVISGSGCALTKAGNGTLTLTGANDFSGGVTLNAGTLVLGNASALGTGSLAIYGGAINPNGAALTINNVNIDVYGDFGLDSPNTYHELKMGSGAVTLHNGTRKITSDTNNGSAGPHLGGAIGDGGNGYGLTKDGVGILYLDGTTSTYSGKTTVMNGSLQVASIANLGSTSSLGQPTTIANGTIDLYPGTSFTVSNGGTTDRVINLAGGAGTVTINGGNNSTTLTLNSALTATGTGPKTLALSTPVGNPTIVIKGGIPNSSDGSPTTLSITEARADFTAVYLNGVNTFTGPINLTLASGAVAQIGGAGQLNSGSYAANITVTGGIFNYASSANQILSGSISGAGSLIMSGAGTLTLSGANTYNGATTVSGGTLVVNGQSGSNSGTGTGAVAVNAGGTLSGNGRIAGAVTVANSALAVLYPNGNSTLTLGGNLAISGASSIVKFNLASTASGANDMVVLENKAVTITGAPVITINLASTALDMTDYVLIDAGVSGSISGAFNTTPTFVGATPKYANRYSIVQVGNTIVLRYSPIVLAVTGAAVTPKPYDGTFAAIITGATLAGDLVGGDAVTLSNANAGTFASKNVGTGIAVSHSMSLSGADSARYTLTPPVLAGNITKASLGITATAQSKTYGQTVTFDSGSLDFSSSGLQNGETVGSVTLACAGGADNATAKNSPYTITPSAATGGTFDPDNYTITYNNGLLTVSKADQVITFTRGLTVQMKDTDTSFSDVATAVPVLAGITYSSGNEAVATVDSSGMVTIQGAGVAIITATQAGNDDYNLGQASQTLTVNDVKGTVYLIR